MSGMEILKRANNFCNQACIINSFRYYVGGEYYNFHEGGNFHKIQNTQKAPQILLSSFFRLSASQDSIFIVKPFNEPSFWTNILPSICRKRNYHNIVTDVEWNVFCAFCVRGKLWSEDQDLWREAGSTWLSLRSVGTRLWSNRRRRRPSARD